MEFAPVGLALTRHKRFEMVSPEMCRMLGRPEAELLGAPTQVIYASNEDFLALEPQVRDAFQAGRTYVGQWQMLRGDGSRLWVQLRGRPIDPDDAHGGTIWSLMDLTEEHQSRARLEWRAQHDGLTGLANRKTFEDRARQVVAARPRSIPAAMVFIDLDQFKPINERWGHATGDDMLRAVASAIGGCVRSADLVARYGGDEFVVLLERCSPKAAVRAGESIQLAIESVRQVRQGEVLHVGASLGVMPLTEDMPDLEAWFAAADAACYRAKAERRGQPLPAQQRSAHLRLVGEE
jgi:diguanylate cyclase (GGDEF)-like protein/PAS domain S-box-containing protein